MSRQREWQKRMVAEGKCQSCGKQRENKGVYCDRCRTRHAEARLRHKIKSIMAEQDVRL